MAINIKKNNQLSQMSALMSNKNIKSIYVKIDNETTCVWGDDLADSLFTYTIQNNSATITGLNPNNQFSGNLSIPNKIKGVPVTAIGSSAFKNNKNIMGITIGSNIIGVSDHAFDGCTSLTSITVAEGNTKYHSSGNCLIETASNTLVLGCKTSVIPSDGSVTSIGGYAFEGCTGLTNITIPDNVTSIGNSAFFGCTGLINITIPGSVTNISDNAFAYCSGLTSVTISGSVTYIGWYAFRNCTGLTSITIPDSVTNIGGYAFAYCTMLTTVTIPGSVTNIGDAAFTGCNKISNIYGSSSTIAAVLKSGGSRAVHIHIVFGTTIIYNAFKNRTEITEVTIGDSIQTIGVNAFYGCTRLTNVVVPDNVTTINDGAFRNCTSLYSITLPFVGMGDNATSDYKKVFGYIFGYTDTTSSSTEVEGATNQYYSTKYDGTPSRFYWYYIPSSLKKVILSDNATGVGVVGFKKCNNITQIIIGSNVRSLGQSDFALCEQLSNVTVSKNNNTYSSVDGILYNSNATRLIFAPAAYEGTLIIPSGVTSIDWYAFSGCRKIKNITIPDSMTIIDKNAFSGCWGLTTVTIPDSVTSIGKEAFNNCTILTSITFKGTKAQWNAISKEPYWNYNTGNYTIHCTDGDIPKQ